MSDGRRRQWQPIATDLPNNNTGAGLKRKFGRDGLLVWVCFLLACKRSFNQGEFEYHTEDDGYRNLGLGYPHVPTFSLDEFFTYTGRMKMTSRRRSGEVVKVSCTRFEEWSKAGGRAVEADKKSRKRAQNTRTLQGRYADDTRTDLDLDSDHDLDHVSDVFKIPPAVLRDVDAA